MNPSNTGGACEVTVTNVKTVTVTSETQVSNLLQFSQNVSSEILDP